ncbi:MULTISPECIES: hypothetical protein [Streptomyces]|uniref:hypothetical protein n=1 Tax=Streptomyces TaxID=1883 RepID=UPI0024768B7A|nr:hypothetical protein [Streptomyces sp. SAI-144]MDH6434869.1 hypothetical protein [Streptomyces sp. SAI-144]
MQVWFEFGGTGRNAQVELPAIPRVGEDVLWITEGEDPDDGTVLEYAKEYRVHQVHWTIPQRPSMTAGAEDPPVIRVRLEPAVKADRSPIAHGS